MGNTNFLINYSMGITVAQYRCSIGCYNINARAHSKKNLTNCNDIFQQSAFNSYNIIMVLYYIKKIIIYIYII